VTVTFVTGPICLLDMISLAVMDSNHAVKVKAVLISLGQQRYRKKDEKF